MLRTLLRLVLHLRVTNLLHWNTEQGWFILFSAMTALLRMWDKPAGRYVTASRSTSRLSELPTLQPLLLLNTPSEVATPLIGMRPQ